MNQPPDLTEQVGRVIGVAWPCFDSPVVWRDVNAGQLALTIADALHGSALVAHTRRPLLRAAVGLPLP